ncbi:hypothetical protein EO087_00270 [Dyella sp. M7H15-1]|uniref:choice-of-anchor tandem repeat GloVer-containing protein n=1 Tax=Dyella sp. M7H15-1 TaxID=2501295 RepID=UPI0010050A5E|nr:choice-of-anchor tandem repeat GloVer-containing protein [Dyella sp. M7H15-1]QAU22600.1 hypothetical protein EO087_00270 [Dyella sp. M7H15-1]
MFKLRLKLDGTFMMTGMYYFGNSGSFDGVHPQAGLIEGANSNFYGTTSSCGAYGMGTVFRVTLQPGGTGPIKETVLHSFGRAL